MKTGRYSNRALTEKQRTILLKATQGKTNKQIAEELKVGTSTVFNTVNILCDIFKVGTREELVAHAKEMENKS
jgi:DNA-binding CsgD family transcriptional regulator